MGENLPKITTLCNNVIMVSKMGYQKKKLRENKSICTAVKSFFYVKPNAAALHALVALYCVNYGNLCILTLYFEF